eukprot:Sspe_Gene.50178::Locus_27713_Transcript_3_3_Confidence_0.600_Length_2071::g.50178::m.50178
MVDPLGDPPRSRSPPRLPLVGIVADKYGRRFFVPFSDESPPDHKPALCQIPDEPPLFPQPPTLSNREKAVARQWGCRSGAPSTISAATQLCLAKITRQNRVPSIETSTISGRGQEETSLRVAPLQEPPTSALLVKSETLMEIRRSSRRPPATGSAGSKHRSSESAPQTHFHEAVPQPPSPRTTSHPSLPVRNISKTVELTLEDPPEPRPKDDGGKRKKPRKGLPCRAMVPVEPCPVHQHQPPQTFQMQYPEVVSDGTADDEAVGSSARWKKRKRTQVHREAYSKRSAPPPRKVLTAWGKLHNNAPTIAMGLPQV